MQTITNDVAIFNLLEKADLISFDPAQNDVFEFSYEHYWCLLLFSASGPAKGCKLFLLENHFLSAEVEKQLLPALLSLPEDNGYDFLKNKALAIAEKLISLRNNEHLFFDAH